MEISLSGFNMQQNMEYRRKRDMDYQNIKIEYRDTPEKFHEAADEVISYLVENLLKLNSIEEECSKLKEHQKRGIRIKGMPKDSEGLCPEHDIYL